MYVCTPQISSPRAVELNMQFSGFFIRLQIMAEGKRSCYARVQHFIRPNPLSKEAISRTTKYREKDPRRERKFEQCADSDTVCRNT